MNSAALDIALTIARARLRPAEPPARHVVRLGEAVDDDDVLLVVSDAGERRRDLDVEASRS